MLHSYALELLPRSGRPQTYTLSLIQHVLPDMSDNRTKRSAISSSTAHSGDVLYANPHRSTRRTLLQYIDGSIDKCGELHSCHTACIQSLCLPQDLYQHRLGNFTE